MREVGTAVPPSFAEDGSAERIARLRQIVDALGGNRAAARRSGVPLSTLNGYLAGGGMKLEAAAALARAAGARLDWLATGEGTMCAAGEPSDAALIEKLRASGLAERHSGGDGDAPLGVTWSINLDRLVQAYEMAQRGIAVVPGRTPDPKRLLQVMLLIYDELSDAEDASKSPSRPD